MEKILLNPFVWVILAIVLLILLGVRIVGQGYNFVIERFGKYHRTLPSGIHFLIPLVDRVSARVNMMENFLDIPSQDVITRDNAAVHVDGVVFYVIKDARMATYNVTDVRTSTSYLVMTNIRTVMGSMDLDELLSKRDEINHKLKTVIDEATDIWGVYIPRVEIKEIKPPRNLLDSMGRQMQAEREKRARILEAEGIREAQIAQAEGQKQSAILQAEAYKAEQVLKAEGRLEAADRDAKARERLAGAEAEATRMMSEAIKKGNADAVNYFVAQKYIEAFSKIAANGNEKIIYMPTEMSGIMSFLGSMTDLIKKH